MEALPTTLPQIWKGLCLKMQILMMLMNHPLKIHDRSLMYLTATRNQKTGFACVCMCHVFHSRPPSKLLTPQLLSSKKILKTSSKPSLGLWLNSPLACKKQTVVATSTTEAEYVAAANCCGQVLWIQNQLLDYGYNFMNTVIYIDNTTLASPEQTATAMASPKQTAIGKDSSNPFMAGSLPKTTLCVNLSAEILTDDNGTVKIHATIDGHSFSITEGSLWRHLKLDDQDGITSLPTTEIFAQLALMGYATDSDKLTFQKGLFSPQWRFLIHNILHCLSPKKTAWEQFSSNIAAAVICLATNRKFNFSRMNFDHMVSNISSLHKFLMYPRFVQLCLDMQRHKLQQHTRVYSVSSLTMKVFSNMKRITKGFSGQEVALFPNMLAVSTPSASPSNSISSSEPTPSQQSPTQPSPQPSQPSLTPPGSEYHPPTPHDSPLHVVHSHGSDEEAQLKVGKARRHSRFVLSDTEVGEDDSSKQGKKFSSEGVQDDEGVHEKASNDTEIFVQEVTPTELIQDQEASGKASDEVSTAGLKKGPVSEEVPTVSTAEATLSTAGGTVTYSRRSAEKRSRKDKGKAILIEEEPKKKSKKDLEQEQLSYAEAIRLEEQMNEEQRAQIARDEEIARQWDEEERKRAMDAAKSTKKIDWNDPSVIRYHSLKMKPKSIAQARRNMIKYLKNQGNYKITDFKGMSYNDIRPIFEKIWDFNQNIKPMDEEQGSKKQKSPEKERSTEKIVEEEAVTQGEREEVVKEPATKRKKSIPRKTTRKRQKLEEDAEKDELKGFLDIVPREEAPIEIESLSTKFPIVDWKTCVLTETFMYYQVFRGDGSSKNYKVLSEMLEDFDRMDVEQLFRLVKERYNTSAPEGFDLMLWGDLHTLFEPDKDDEIWRDQHEYNF
ncbi:hypothetical protein Tco_0185771 [Tanacetum coccineum]